MLRLDDCLHRSEAGKKAQRLAQVRAAGLRVLDGFVVLPGEPVESLESLGERLIVRSSSAQEDVAGASAAGVFESVINVPIAQVKEAVERVRASAQGEAAAAYLAAHGLSPAPLAVLIQPMSRAPKLAVAMSAAAGFLVEERRSGEPEWGDVEARRVESGPLYETLRALEALIGGPVDAELALGDDITVLQVRPRARGPLEEVDAAYAAFSEPGRWKLDAEHNPRALSAAQAGLVTLVESLGVGPRQRVVAGHLYVEVGGAPRGLHALPLADLRRRFDEEVAPDCLKQLAAAADLEGALAAYGHVYRRYVGEVAPSVARAKAQLDQLLRMNLHEPLSQHGALLGGVGGAPLRRDQALWELTPERLPQFLAEFGAWSPAWDVAVATDEEAPERLLKPPVEPLERHRAAEAVAEKAAHEVLERLDRMSRRAFKALLPTVRAAVEVGEDDDALFFEAQRTVRRALLQLGVDGIFDMPLERVRRGQYDLKIAPIAVSDPPLWIEDGRALRPLPQATQVLRGHATAGHARGRAVRPGQALPDDAVLVVPALLPSLAHLLPRCRALVTEHGGATSHGATLARECGVPAVLGVRGAGQIADGSELYVDGANGRVYLL